MILLLGQFLFELLDLEFQCCIGLCFSYKEELDEVVAQGIACLCSCGFALLAWKVSVKGGVRFR